MNKIFKLTLILILVTNVTFGQTKKNRKIAGYTKQDYEISCVGVGVEGTKLVSIYGYGKNPEKATRYAKLNAVHGIIFRGAPGGGGGCQGINALASSVTVESQNQAYFDSFFAPGGGYLNFVNYSDQNRATRSVTKIDKKTYKVGMVLSINYTALRKELESAGIIKGLSSGF